ncbi:MAG: hypothetical protein AB1772_10285 [Candidatus Zixiibacteriota bacterium]
MHIKLILAVLLLAAVIAACSSEQMQPSSLVTSAGTAPYYTNLDDALEAARADQFVVLDFYTDW